MTRLIIFGLISSLAWGVLAPSQTLAQDGGQPVQPAGVRIDASGVLRMQFFSDPTGRLGRQRINEMRAELDADVARRSKLRKISLTRLEAVIAERLATGGGLTEDMRNLVGLTPSTDTLNPRPGPPPCTAAPTSFILPVNGLAYSCNQFPSRSRKNVTVLPVNS
jgi:hypothetical protein